MNAFTWVLMAIPLYLLVNGRISAYAKLAGESQ